MRKLLTLSMLTIMVFGGVAQAEVSLPHDFVMPYWDAADPNASGSEGNIFVDSDGATCTWAMPSVIRQMRSPSTTTLTD